MTSCRALISVLMSNVSEVELLLARAYVACSVVLLLPLKAHVRLGIRDPIVVHSNQVIADCLSYKQDIQQQTMTCKTIHSTVLCCAEQLELAAI